MVVQAQTTWQELNRLNKHQLALLIVSDNGRKEVNIDGLQLARLFERRNSRQTLQTHAWKHILG